MPKRPSRWRAIAEEVIIRERDAARAEGCAEDEVLRRVDVAYPFGIRKYHPYQMWLKARRELLGLPGSVSRADQARLAAWEAAARSAETTAPPPATPLDQALAALGDAEGEP